ncbi:hypothetical protein J4E08_10895 [Sagittula sp. NFXS13]|uniref:hypothetical protein n=1 Tax=Sagittula sp. NFXS13 TaxID=2819095 RepID=UPI0032DF7792
MFRSFDHVSLAKANADGIKSDRRIPRQSSAVALTTGLPRKQVTAGSGIGFSTLNRWIQRERRNSEKPPVQSDPEPEIAELRKENRMRPEERDALLA